MANKGGKRNRRKMPEPDIKKEPDYHGTVLCLHCNQLFDAETMGGEYLSRTCPKCGHTISATDYDGIAFSYHKKQAAAFADIYDFRKQQSELKEKIEKQTHWWQGIQRWFAERKLNRTETKLQDANKIFNELRSKTECLTSSRYHAGEWFLRTRSPLSRSVVMPFSIHAKYDKDGQFQLTSKDIIGTGLKAEFVVSDRLLQKIADPKSALYKAEIVPNIYLNHNRRRSQSFWCQIDLLLLTTKAAFVIEVKSRKGSICSNSPFKDISGRWEKKKKDHTPALYQNSKHATEFDEACPEYPFEKIYEQVVFVGPNSFKSDVFEFVDNINVGHMSKCDCPDFTHAIEKALEGLDDLMTSKEVHELAEKLLSEYGDLNQKRFAIHASALGANL